MLWRIRTTLDDRPGSLARLAQCCGDRHANILALQIFPGMEGVTDELVLSTPEDWTDADVVDLVAAAGGRDSTVSIAPERALVDEPTRYLQAARQIHDGLVPAAEVLGHLLGAVPEPDPVAGSTHTLSIDVGGTSMVLHRAEAFTPTEHARAAAMAALVDAVADPPPVVDVGPDGVVLREAVAGDHEALQRMHARCSARTVYHRYGVPLLRLTDRLARRLSEPSGGVIVAMVGDEMIGIAQAVRRGGGTTPELSVLVEDDWQRRGMGTRLVYAALGQLAAEGYREAVLRGQVDNPGLVPLVTRLGLHVRVRVVGDSVTALLAIAGLRAGGGTAPAEEMVRG